MKRTLLALTVVVTSLAVGGPVRGQTPKATPQAVTSKQLAKTTPTQQAPGEKQMFARPMRWDNPKIDSRVAFLKNDLKLSDAQAARVKGLFVKQGKEAMGWQRANPHPTAPEVRRYRAAMVAERSARLREILNQTQMKLLPPPDPEDKCNPTDEQCIKRWMSLYGADPSFQ